ncbi:MAG: hypothetical protein ACI9U0_001725 [Flavobacteriales bacterium]|jgi:hypothetical protein|tara:strand:- start:108 stop:698 length:591 start_codon:yes stop_codon:yes gene_type:complete
MSRSFSYLEYKGFFEELVNQGITTGLNPSDSLIEYTKLNWSRAKRVDKKFKPLVETSAFLKSFNRQIKLKIITEPWCGDAAQVVPAIARLAELSGNFETEIVLRDENEELINRHLTNGGKSIPITVIIDAQTDEVLGHWGPRPIVAQQMVMDYKAKPENERSSYDDFVQEMQQWYNKDKTASIQNEFIQKLIELLG